MAILGDDLDAVRFDGSSDKRVNIIVKNFAHEPHLFHRFAIDIEALGKHQILSAHNRAAISSHFGEHLVDGYARQTQLSTIPNK